MKSCLPKWTSSPRWARCVFFCSLMKWGSTQIWSKTWEEIRWLTGPGQSWKGTDVGNPFYIMKIIWKARWSWTKLAIKNLFSRNKMGDPLRWSYQVVLKSQATIVARAAWRKRKTGERLKVPGTWLCGNQGIPDLSDCDGEYEYAHKGNLNHQRTWKPNYVSLRRICILQFFKPGD